MKKLSINREGYELEIIDRRTNEKIPTLVIGSSIYYNKLFSNSVYDEENLIFVDHRGFTKSSIENAGFTLENIVEDIEAIRQRMNLKEMNLLGHSGHGFMAMAYASRYSEFVNVLILSNLAPSNSKERQDGSIEYFEKHADENRKQQFYADWQKFQEKKEFDFTGMNRAMKAHAFYDYTLDTDYLWNDVVNNMPALDYLWGEAFSIFDTDMFFKEYNKQVILLLSKYDYLVAPTSLWKNIVFENDNVIYGQFRFSGHNPMYEEPEEFVKFMNLYE